MAPKCNHSFSSPLISHISLCNVFPIVDIENPDFHLLNVVAYFFLIYVFIYSFIFDLTFFHFCV